MNKPHDTCRHCRFSIPADAPVCPGCRRPAIDDWRRKVRRQHAVERRARHATPPLHDDGYRSLLGPATAARAMLSLASVVGVVTAAVMAAWTVRVDEPVLTLDSSSVDLEVVGPVTAAALLGVLAITGVAFVIWAVRAYRNLPALAIEERRYWTIWLVVGWIIPGANLLVPKLVVDDLWRASSPEAGVLGGDGWQRRPVASIVNRWWWSFLLTPGIAVTAFVTLRGGIDDFELQLLAGALSVAGACSIVIAAVSARGLVAVVTVAQARRADVIVDLRESQRDAVAHLLAMESRTG